MSPEATTKAIEVIVERMLPPQPEMAIVRRVTPNGADIQLAYSGRYLKDVPALRGETLEIGDFVVVLRVKSSEAQWVILGAASTAYRGRPSGIGTTVVPAPISLTATGRYGYIEVFWPGAKVDTVVAYELQHNSSASPTGATTVDLRTNQYDYHAADGVTRHFRVRAVGDSYIRSGWTSWTSATVAGPAFGSVTDFTDLTDTPSSYTGEASSIPMVNPTEERLAFTALSFLNLADTDFDYTGHASEVPVVPPGENRLALTALAFLSLGDTPNTYAGSVSKIPMVHPDGDRLVFETIPAAGAHDHSSGAQGGTDLQGLGTINLKDATEVTINIVGAIVVTQVYHRVDTFGDAAADDLTQISAAGGAEEGDIIILRPEDGARTVVVKHGADNIWLQGKADISLDDASDHIMLVYDGTNWCDLY